MGWVNTVDTYSANQYYSSAVCRWGVVTANLTGTVSQLHVYNGTQAQSTDIIVAIYDASNNKIGSGTGNTGTGTSQWITVNLDASVNVTNGLQYKLCVEGANANSTIGYNGTTGYSADNAYASGLPDPLPTGFSGQNLIMIGMNIVEGGPLVAIMIGFTKSNNLNIVSR